MVRFLSIRNPVRLVAWQGPRNNILCQAVTKGRPSAYPWRWQDARDEEDCPMASLFTDDDRLKKPSMHEIGQDLALLSVKEIDERIEVLQTEISRLEDARLRKDATKAAADAFFRKMT
jgi:uncharacterized small protein (DUF1192 family)